MGVASTKAYSAGTHARTWTSQPHLPVTLAMPTVASFPRSRRRSSLAEHRGSQLLLLSNALLALCSSSVVSGQTGEWFTSVSDSELIIQLSLIRSVSLAQWSDYSQ